MIRDQILLDLTRHNLELKCLACNSNEHSLIKCPWISHQPNRNIIIKRHIFSKNNGRRKVKRKKKSKGLNSLLQNRNIRLAIERFQEVMNYPLKRMYSKQGGDSFKTDSDIQGNGYFDVENRVSGHENLKLADGKKLEKIPLSISFHPNGYETSFQNVVAVSSMDNQASFTPVNSRKHSICSVGGLTPKNTEKAFDVNLELKQISEPSELNESSVFREIKHPGNFLTHSKNFGSDAGKNFHLNSEEIDIRTPGFSCLEEIHESTAANLAFNFEQLVNTNYSKPPKRFQLADLPNVTRPTPHKHPMFSDSEDESVHTTNEKKMSALTRSPKIFSPEGNLFDFDFEKERSYNIYMPHNNLQIVISNFQTIMRKEEIDWMSIRKVKARTKETEKLSSPKKRIMKTTNLFKNNNHE